jgi:hypothetical protein
MGIGAQLESDTAREGRVVENGQGLNFSDIGKILCNSPYYKTLSQQILAEIQNNPYHPRLLSRCKEGSTRGDRGTETCK